PGRRGGARPRRQRAARTEPATAGPGRGDRRPAMTLPQHGQGCDHPAGQRRDSGRHASSRGPHAHATRPGSSHLPTNPNRRRHEHLGLNENARGGVTMTTSEANDHATLKDRRTSTTELSWMLWTAIGIGGIWIAVLLISLLAP